MGLTIKQCDMPSNGNIKCKFFSEDCHTIGHCRKLALVALDAHHEDKILIGTKIYKYVETLPGNCEDCIKWHRRTSTRGHCYELEHSTGYDESCGAFVPRRVD